MSGRFATASPQDQIHALALTRFHFMTLKQFHSDLFTSAVDQGLVGNNEATLINRGLNAFLASGDRETMLLRALRENKAVRLRFSVPEQTSEYEMITNPEKEVLFRLEPVKRNVAVVVQLRPMLDGPIAFEINIQKGEDLVTYFVDWMGKITGQPAVA